MYFSLVILALCLIIFVNSSDNVDYCIWGRTQDATTYVNGLYKYTANPGSLAYYEKIDTNCPSNHLFLYQASGKWLDSTYPNYNILS